MHSSAGHSVVEELMRAHVMDSPPAPLDYAPGLPRELSGAVLRMLAKDASDRWPDIGVAVAALDHSSRENHESSRSKIGALVRGVGSNKPVAAVALQNPVRRNRGRTRRMLIIGSLSATAATIIAGFLVYPRMPLASVAPNGSIGIERRLTRAATPTSRSQTGSVGTPTIPASSTPRESVAAVAAWTPLRLALLDARIASGPRAKRPRLSFLSQKCFAPVANGGSLDKSKTDGGAPLMDSLRKRTLGPVGFVRIGSRVPTAVLYIDGTERGPITSLLMLSLSARVTRIGVHAAGCAPWDSTVSIANRDTLRLNFRNPRCR